MRFIQAVLLLTFLGAIAVFALQNNQIVTVQLLNGSISAPLALTIVGVYLLGMVSGWTVVAFVRRSIWGIREPHR
jgi:uncharacterized integral membrane protein